jgi:hypothetical protein
LKCLFLPGLIDIAANHPNADLESHVDDFSVIAIARYASDVFSTVHAMLFDLAKFLTVDLGMLFAPSKVFVVSNSGILAKRAARSFGAYGGDAVKSITRLGIPYSSGKKLTAGALNVRLPKATKRSSCLALLTHSAAPCPRLFYGGILPAADYGTECIGASLAMRKKLSAQAMRSHHLPARLSSNAIVWHILSLGRHKWPFIDLAVRPIQRLAREWWYSTDRHSVAASANILTPPQLIEAHGSSILMSSHDLASDQSPVSIALHALRSFNFVPLFELYTWLIT